MPSDKYCSIPGCSNKKALGHVLHSFPNPMKYPEHFDSWKKNIGAHAFVGLSDEHIFKNRRVCRAHFELRYLCRYNKLSKIAIPTISLQGVQPASESKPVEAPLNSNGVTHHQFPHPEKNPDRFKAWVLLVGGKLESPQDYENYKKRVICDRHFKAEDKNRNNRLNFMALPSLYLPGDQPASESKPVEVPLNSIDEALPVDNTITTNIGVEKPVTDHEAVPVDNTITTNMEIEKPITDHKVAQPENATINTDICTDVAAEEVVSECEGLDDCDETITETNNSYDNLHEFLIISKTKGSLSTAVQTKKNVNENIDPVPAVPSKITCDNCNKTVVGFHYKCLHCVKYTHCHICEMKEAHPNHYMIRMPKSPVPKASEKTIDNIFENFKAAYISSREENQRRGTISYDNKPNHNSKACDSDVDLPEDVKSLIRKEVTRAVKNKLVDKTNQLKTYLKIKRKQHLQHDTLKKRKITVITNTINDEAPPVIEIGQNDNASAPINNKSKVDHDENKHKESVSTIATILMDATSPGVVHMKVTDIVTQLILEITQDDEKIIYKYVDT